MKLYRLVFIIMDKYLPLIIRLELNVLTTRIQIAAVTPPKSTAHWLHSAAEMLLTYK